MKRKIAAALSLMLSTSVLLGGYGSVEVKAESSGTVHLKVWVDEDSVDQTKEMAAAFAAENPDKEYDIEVVVSDSMKAQEYIKNDPEAAADVFMLPHDQLGQLVESGTVYKNTKYADDMYATMTDASLEGASYDGDLYAYPYGVETCLLYYNKSVLTEEDVKTFAGITAKGKIGMNLAESVSDYQIAPCFMANGCYLYGESGEDPAGTTFNDEHGLEVLKWIAGLKNNDGVVHVKDDMVSAMAEGKIAAAIGGPWNKNDLLEALGDDLGVAAYPTVDFGSGEKQMYAFQGVKLFAVNSSTEEPLDAMAFADYLVNEENQIKRFELTGIIPSNKNAQENEAVKADEVGQAVAVMSQDDHSVVMPKIPEVGTFWQQCSPLINDAYAGNIPEDEMQAKLDQFVAEISE